MQLVNEPASRPESFHERGIFGCGHEEQSLSPLPDKMYCFVGGKNTMVCCDQRCRISADTLNSVNKSCRMWFQRVSEDADVNVSTADTDDRSTRTTRNFTKKATGPAIHPRDFQRVKLMMKLTNTGANVNLADDRGETALLAAIQSADSKILEIIAEAGADVNLADGRGTTPLYEAAWSDHSEVVKLLYQQKKSRETALHGPRRSPQGPR